MTPFHRSASSWAGEKNFEKSDIKACNLARTCYTIPSYERYNEDQKEVPECHLQGGASPRLHGQSPACWVRPHHGLHLPAWHNRAGDDSRVPRGDSSQGHGRQDLDEGRDDPSREHREVL